MGRLRGLSTGADAAYHRWVLSHSSSRPPTEYRIPTTTLTVEIISADATRQRGQLFLAPAAAHHAGAERPEERLNDDSDFFPFLPENQERSVIVNKHQVIVLSFDLTQSEQLRRWWGIDTDEDEILIPHMEQRILVECDGVELEGVLVMDAPQHQRRTQDLLNRAERFICLRDDDQLHLINRKRIVRASEIASEAPEESDRPSEE